MFMRQVEAQRHRKCVGCAVGACVPTETDAGGHSSTRLLRLPPHSPRSMVSVQPLVSVQPRGCGGGLKWT
jgi:hypothetical protein